MNQGFCDASIIKSKSNFSIHFLKCFFTVCSAPITTGIASTFLVFQILAISYCSSLQLEHFSSFLSVWMSSGHGGFNNRHFFLFLSIKVRSRWLCSKVLSVCIGKSHKIFLSSDSKTFSGLCMYHFSSLSNPHFFAYLPMYHFGNFVMLHLFVHLLT